jgi:hypothetical protein
MVVSETINICFVQQAYTSNVKVQHGHREKRSQQLVIVLYWKLNLDEKDHVISFHKGQVTKETV